jgi:hypothetical protein
VDRKLTLPLVAASALFVAAGGYIHLTEWLDTYRDVPSNVPGSEVVTIGFPVNVAVSVLAVVALVVAAWKLSQYLWLVVAGTFLFQAGSLATLILSRTGSVFGWTEPTWNDAANQTRAVEIGAMLCLAALGGILAMQRGSRENAATS